MKFHFALLCVLCAHAIAHDEITMNEKGRLTHMTPKLNNIPDASVVIAMNATSNGTSITSKCSPGASEKFTVGVQGILAKNGVEYVYLPLDEPSQAACFDSYNYTILNASDLVSCCNAAAVRGYNSFRFDGGGCKGFKAWLNPVYGNSLGLNGLVSPGLFVAKRKLSDFKHQAPILNASSSLTLSRIVVNIHSLQDDCQHTKMIKVTNYFKTKTYVMPLLFLSLSDSFEVDFYLPELCDDSASAAKRTVTISILDTDRSEIVSVTQVASSSGITGRHLLSNGVCVMYDASQPLDLFDAKYKCFAARSKLPSGDGFFPYADLQKELAGLTDTVGNFWTSAYKNTPRNRWEWGTTIPIINMSFFNAQSLTNSFTDSGVIGNAADGLLHKVDATSLQTAVCMDAPYYSSSPGVSNDCCQTIVVLILLFCASFSRPFPLDY